MEAAFGIGLERPGFDIPPAVEEMQRVMRLGTTGFGVRPRDSQGQGNSVGKELRDPTRLWIRPRLLPLCMPTWSARFPS